MQPTCTVSARIVAAAAAVLLAVSSLGCNAAPDALHRELRTLRINPRSDWMTAGRPAHSPRIQRHAHIVEAAPRPARTHLQNRRAA